MRIYVFEFIFLLGWLVSYGIHHAKLYLTELCRTSWNLMESHGTLQYPAKPHEISWKVPEHGGIFWLLTNDNITQCI
jgi:hypothetical protein